MAHSGFVRKFLLVLLMGITCLFAAASADGEESVLDFAVLFEEQNRAIAAAAKEDYQQAEEILRDLMNKWYIDSSGVLKSYAEHARRDLRVVLQLQGKYEEATEIEAQTIKGFSNWSNAEISKNASALYNYASALSRESNFLKAASVYRTLVSGIEAAGDLAHPRFLPALDGLANSYFQLGWYGPASRKYRELLKKFEEQPTNSDTASNLRRTLGNLGLTYVRMGDIDAAIPLFSKQLLFAFQSRTEALDVDIETGPASSSDDPLLKDMNDQFVRMFLETMSIEKTMALRRSLPTQYYNLSLAITNLSEMSSPLSIIAADEVLSFKGLIREKIASRRQSTFEYRQRNPKDFDDFLKLLASRNRSMDSTAEDLNLEIAIRQREILRGLDESQLKVGPVRHFDVSQALPEDAIYVDYVIYEHVDVETMQPLHDRVAAIVISPNGDVSITDLGELKTHEIEIQKFVDPYRNPELLLGASIKLYRMLLEPIRARLGENDRMYFAADGVISRVPFALLRSGPTAQPLIEEIELHRLGGVRTLLTALPPIRDKRALLVGGLDFGKGEDQCRTTNGVSRLLSRGFNDDNLFDMSFCQLPASMREIEMIRGVLKDRSDLDLTMLSDTLATEGTVRDEIVDHNILHFATHASFFPSAVETNAFLSEERVKIDPLASPFLAFSNANAYLESGTSNDGLLHGTDISWLPLSNVGLVFLSACDTAVGQDARGEGIASLAHAFGIAGARTVISTLWKVEDESAARFATEFYKNLFADTPSGISEAFRKTQIDWMKRGEPVQNWAGFILTNLRGKPLR